MLRPCGSHLSEMDIFGLLARFLSLLLLVRWWWQAVSLQRFSFGPAFLVS